ncbi:MAG: hypothetical protein AMXMBFR84_21230 [Candidatus Hydrogenedentota bacterium]
MVRPRWIVTALVSVVLGTGVAHAWGPLGDSAVVSAGVRLVADDTKIPLQNLMRDIQAGSSVGSQEMVRLIPNADVSPISAIESEMHLLRAVRGDRVDPYFAYRLGVLGKLVAGVTTPLVTSESPVKNVYLADVEKNITKVRVDSSTRAEVSPATYFPNVIQQANIDADMLIRDYEGGLGFDGIAKASLAEDASRSVNAVADVLYTVLKDRAVVATVSQNQTRDYYLLALEFFLKRGNEKEAELVHAKLLSVDSGSPDLHKQVGDLYFSAKLYERGVAEYERVLALQPERRDVVERLAQHYLSVGDKEIEDGNLEAAEEAYAKAAATDKLNPDTTSKLMKTRTQRADRDMRMTSASSAIEQAAELTAQAEQFAFNRQFGEAMQKLTEAQGLYQSVGTEFPELARESRNGLFTIQTEMDKLRSDLVNSAPSLSGLGRDAGVRKLAVTTAGEVGASTLQAIVKSEYDAEIDRLKQQYEPAIISAGR